MNTPDHVIDKIIDRRIARRLTPEEYDLLPPLPPHEQVLAEVKREIALWLDLCERTWDYRPALAFSSYASTKCVIIKVEFNIKGFSHKGQRMYVNRRSYRTWRSPKHLAREIIAEISQHRNTCMDCGEGIANIHTRVQGGWHWDGQPAGFVLGYDRSPRGRLVRIYLDTEVPPDSVEEKLHPVLSRKLKTRLSTPAAAEILFSPLRKKILGSIRKGRKMCLRPPWEEMAKTRQ
jgi:hypothetical protein